MVILPIRVCLVRSQPKSNKFLAELRLILIFIWNKDPEIAKRILKKNQVEGFRDIIYVVINP